MLFFRLKRNIHFLLAVLAAIFVFGSGPAAVAQTDPPLVFQKLNYEQGLSQGYVTSIVQDHSGFIYVGTNDGLNRYDSYGFLVFRHDPDDPNSLRSNQINALIVDQHGKIWVGTARGLNVYDPETGQFRFIENRLLTANTYVFSLTFDRDGVLWVGTFDGGLVSYDPLSGLSQQYVSIPGKDMSLISNEVRMVYADRANRIWVSTREGNLQLLDRHAGNFRTFTGLSNAPHISESPIVLGLREDHQGNLWMASYGGGLARISRDLSSLELFPDVFLPSTIEGRNYTFNDLVFQGSDSIWISTENMGLICYTLKNKQVRIIHQGDNNRGFMHNTLGPLFLDKRGNLWVGTKGMGLNLLVNKPEPFRTFTPHSDDGMSLGFSSLRGIYEESQDIIWIGGYNGMQRIDLGKQKVEWVLGVTFIPYAILPDRFNPDFLWIGTEGQGLIRLNKRTLKREMFPFFESFALESGEAPGWPRVFSLEQDGEGWLYIGTNLGLTVYNPNEGHYFFYRNDPDNPRSIPQGRVISLYNALNGRLWVGTDIGGLAFFDKATKEFTGFRPSTEPGGLLGHRVNCFFEDRRGNLWVGTNMGLHFMYVSEGRFRAFLESDGLANNMVYGVLEDRYGHLWLSTNKGLSRFNPRLASFLNFDADDGLPGNEFNTASFSSIDPGRLLFGGVNGLVMVDPSKVGERSEPRPVVLTRIIKRGQHASLTSYVPGTQTIRWEKQFRTITLEFSSLDYSRTSKPRYVYAIGKEPGDFIDLGVERSITLMRPRKGTFLIHIAMVDPVSGMIGIPRTITIEVLPRFYETWMFRLLMTLALALLVFMYVYNRIGIIKTQKRKLEQTVEKRTAELVQANEQLKDANASKDRFISILAHDLKNPFHALIGFTDIMINDWQELDEAGKMRIIGIIRNNAHVTYQLLLNLLDWAKIQKSSNNLTPQAIECNHLVLEVFEQLHAQAEFKQIDLINELDERSVVWADRPMASTIMRNLISNGIKFTPNGGRIRVSASQYRDNLSICVDDNGTGIAPELISRLLEPGRGDSLPGTLNEKGSGLGLMLCVELAKRNGGEIRVESQPGKGSRFYLILPVPANKN